MRKALRLSLALTVVIGTVGSVSAATAAEPTPATAKQSAEAKSTDIKDQLLAIKGMKLVEEKPYDGYRYFVLEFTQPVDHRNPSKGTFQQRITVLHKDVSRPTVMFTSGYNVSTTPRRAEPTQIIDGNQISVEYRFFTPSRPEPADWTKLDIWQAASDQHRLYKALKPLYKQNWLTTGGSKGGMTATYYERFYPKDMDGVVAYVAPNDVVNNEDSAYDEFFENVGTKECRDKLNSAQREALVRRESMSKLYADYAKKGNYTFNTVGSLDKAFEGVVLDVVWGFWQYGNEADCGKTPDAKTATDQQLFDWIEEVGGWSSYSDQGLTPYTPYYYQAGTQLGSPDIELPHLADLSRYGYQPPRNFVPRDIPMRFKPSAMRDVDSWVRKNANHMMFVNGENDPWSSEPFHLGNGARDSYIFKAPGANHGANVAGLVPDEKAKATARILAWAGVAPKSVQADASKAKPLAPRDAKLDRAEELRKHGGLRP